MTGIEHPEERKPDSRHEPGASRDTEVQQETSAHVRCQRLGHISRWGDAYLRMLLVRGARSVLNTAARHTDRLSLWALSLQARRGMHKALVGIAAKNARIAWALLSKDQTLCAV